MKKTVRKDLRHLYNSEYVVRNCEREQFNKQRLMKILSFIKFDKYDIVGDFGCGNGLLLDLLFKRIYFYYGIDFSEEFINLSRKRQVDNDIRNASFFCIDIVDFCNDRLCFFDKALAFDFCEHVYDDDFILIFGSIRDSLKKDGKLFIHTPDGDYFLELFKRFGILKQFPEHVAVRERKQYYDLLRQIGFSSVRFRFLSHYLDYLSFFHFLSRLPLYGSFFNARLLIECSK